ncbi:hypothetical protein P4S70_01985 [Enterovibrio sp. Hal110]
MSKEALLDHLIGLGKFQKKGAVAPRVAQLAVSKGFYNLTPVQQGILEPFLSEKCAGSTDPNGNHTDCTKILSDEELLNAYEESMDNIPVCESCSSQEAFYALS